MGRAGVIVVVLAICALLVGPAVAKRDHKAPRITAAKMQDADGDALADRLLLTYSERIRHGVDHDGKYPYAVTGYRIRSVGAAKGKTITLALVERATTDTNAKPAVRYKRTKSKPVRDGAGNQAAGQLFRATKAHGHKPTLVPSDTTPPETTLVTGPSGTAATRSAAFTYSSPDAGATFECGLDGAAFSACPAAGAAYSVLADGAHTFRVRARDAAGNVDATPEARAWSIDGDGDGSLAPADCAPDNAAINPSAADAPELSFADTNCDGVDGTEAKAVFVSPIGNDAAPGTRAAPMRTLAAAVAAAAAAGKQVYSTFGTYTERLTVANGVGVYGGYGTDWSRSLLSVTRITGATSSGRTEGALAASISASTVLQHLTFEPAAGPAGGGSSYAVRGLDSPGLVLDHVVATAGPGTAGAAGTSGRNGVKGKDGAPGGTGSCTDPFPGGGGGVTGPRTGRQGGEGGRGGIGGLFIDNAAQPGQDGAGIFGGPGGPGGDPGDPGGIGGAGSNGGFGSSGADGAGAGAGGVVGSIFVTNAGQSGASGTDGSGGGGGGGGGDQDCTACNEGSGNGGGEGGDGGERGLGGLGGGGGGGSFGVFLVNSTGAVVRDSIVTAFGGGAGGLGGDGGAPGAGGARGLGGTACTGEVGAGGNGGLGGAGGRGGDGGGGGGGPSIALAWQGSITRIGNTLSHGAGGNGGNGLGGIGANGQAANELQF